MLIINSNQESQIILNGQLVPVGGPTVNVDFCSRTNGDLLLRIRLQRSPVLPSRIFHVNAIVMVEKSGRNTQKESPACLKVISSFLYIRGLDSQKLFR